MGVPDLAILAEGFPPGHGALGLLSGDEFLPGAREFDRALLGADGWPRRIGLILCADHRAAPNSLRLARAHFLGLGAETTALDMHADDPLPDFDVAYIGGGSPRALLDCLRGNPRWTEVEARWHRGRAMVGSSAGAMVLCTHCLAPDEGAKVPTRWTAGLGPVRTVALAVHASSRPRAWLEAIARAAPVPLLALDDSTGVLLREDTEPQVAGPGTAWFVT